jgi:alpha,alpha-trehalase
VLRAWPIASVVFALASCEPARAPPRDVRHPPRPSASSGSEAVSTPSVVRLSRAESHALLCRLLVELDEDCDRRITVNDDAVPKSLPSAAPRWPHPVDAGGVTLALSGPAMAAQLVQELVVGIRARGDSPTELDLDRVRADPVSYLAYRIDTHFWDALTRRIDADPERLLKAAADEKLGAEAALDAELCPDVRSRCPAQTPTPSTPAAAPPRVLHVYHPAADPEARQVFERAGIPGRLAIHALPEKPTPAWVLETTRADRHGLLTLALGPDGSGRPFVVPGGRFNEMYGWDSYFMAWALAEDARRIELARSIADNHAYEITQYGKILNANRTYYLTRSQPPFFTSTISSVWSHLSDTPENRRWLERVLAAAIREYRTVWSVRPRRLPLCEGDVCLARYFGEGVGEPPEVEPGHFDWFFQAHALEHGHCRAPGEDAESRSRFLECTKALTERYRSGKSRDRAIDDFFANDRCVRESGHDTTFRWFADGTERCADFATVDLNALLFKYEIDIATFIARVFGGTFGPDSSAAFCARAKARSALVQKYLWDPEAGLFFDYDTRGRKRSRFLASTTLYPLWASAPNACGVSLLSPGNAVALRDRALRELEAPGGLLATAPASYGAVRPPSVLRRNASGAFEVSTPGRQWEAPNGWAPHQMLAWVGLDQAGFSADAERLAYRWLFTIVKNAASFHGTVPEKFDVVARSHAVFQEYGNVNTEFSYIADEGFGWMNASFVVGWRRLGPELREALKALVPPEQLFGEGPSRPSRSSAHPAPKPE